MLNIPRLQSVICFTKCLGNKSTKTKYGMFGAPHALLQAGCKYPAALTNSKNHNNRSKLYCITNLFSMHVFLKLKVISEANQAKIGGLLLNSLLTHKCDEIEFFLQHII